MDPDLVLLRELIDASPQIRPWPGGGLPEASVRAAESVMGPLPPSFRWWLMEYGGGALHGVELATVPPPGHEDAFHPRLRREGDRLPFYEEPDCGDVYSFAPFAPGGGPGRECPVVRRDGLTGEEEPFADSFAGFLTVFASLAAGLRDGPNPAVAQLWRSTPGVLLPSGVLIYGPHSLPERNSTFEVGLHAPSWTLIGDDSGGGGLFMRHHGKDRTSVHHLGLGAITEDVADEGVRVTDDLVGWVRGGAALG